MPQRKDKEDKIEAKIIEEVEAEEELEDYDGWKYIFYAGTDLKSYENVINSSWNFNKFSDDLEDDGIITAKVAEGYHCYVFGGVEPTTLSRLDGKTFKVNGIKTSDTLVCVPHLAVVFTKYPLPSLYGVTSIQMEGDLKRLPMEALRLGWAPFADSDGDELAALKKAKLRPIYYLETAMRPKAFKQLSEDKQALYEYGNPFVVRPKLIEQDIEDTKESFANSNVIELANEKVNGVDVDLSIDLAFDKPTPFIAGIIEKYQLPDTDEIKAEIRAILTPHIQARKAENSRAIAAREELLKSIPAEIAAANDEMIIWKYYPIHSTGLYDVTPALNKRINRFFGDADAVYHHETEVCKEERSVMGMFLSHPVIESAE